MFFPIEPSLSVTVHCKNLRPAYFPRWKKFLSDDGPQRSFDLLKLTKIAGAGTYVDVTHAFQSHCMKVLTLPRNDLLCPFNWRCRPQWKYAQMNNRHPWSLKEIKIKTVSPKRAVTIVHFTTISGHFLANPFNIFHKTEALLVILN